MAPPDATAAASIGQPAARARWTRAALGLLFTPLVVGIAAIVLPRIPVGDPSASMIVFGGAASTTLAALAIAATSHPPPGFRIAVTAMAAVALGVLAWTGVSSMAAALTVDAMLVAAAWAIGGSIGRGIEHPGHLLPACVVVACA